MVVKVVMRVESVGVNNTNTYKQTDRQTNKRQHKRVLVIGKVGVLIESEVVSVRLVVRAPVVQRQKACVCHAHLMLWV